MDTVHVYVYDGYADWEPAYLMAGLQSPRFQREPGRWQVRTVGARDEPVRSMGGLHVLPDLTWDDVSPADSAMLVLPGGEGWEDDPRHDPAARQARRWLQAGKPVAAICGATAGLARQGLLDQRPHTSNAAAYLRGTGYAGGDHYRDEPAVRHAGLITAGGMSAVDFTREVFAELGVYDDAALEAWYRLYKDGDSRAFAALAEAAEQSRVST
jgi:putative intracellular protease/amidase